MKTISRNSKKLTAIFDNARNCRVYTLDNGFIGKDCTNGAAEAAYQQFSKAKLREVAAGTYTVTVHSNLWFEFSI
jgi:hypothetical protein